MFKLTIISVVLFLTTAINLAVTVVAWRRRKTRNGLYFALGMVSVTLWTLAVGLGYAAVPLDLKIILAMLDAVGYHGCLVLFLFFSMYFANLDRLADKTWFRAFIFLFPISNLALIFTNGLHGWVWKGFRPVGNNIVVFEHGPAFTWIAVTGYLMILSIIATLWWASTRGPEIARRQGRLLLFASIFPIVANMVYLYGIHGTEGVDWSSVTFSVTGLLCLRALYGARLMDIVPIARDKLVASMSEGMLVVDTQNRIIDINPAAGRMLEVQPSTVIGVNLKDVAEDINLLLENVSEQEIRSEFVSGISDKRYYDVLVSPLYDQSHITIIGRLIIFHDITERVQKENALQRAHAEMLAQQRSLVVFDERQQLARNLHDSVNQSIHSLVLFSETLTSLLEKGNLKRSLAISERLQESARQALKETRLLLYQLQPSNGDEAVDLLRDLEARIASVERRAGLKADLVLEGAMEDCPEMWKENLFWITIEALNNSLKHAQARKVQIILRIDATKLELEIADNGIGFDLDHVHVGGMGLHNMQERAELIGGKLSLISAPGNGTRVHFCAEP